MDSSWLESMPRILMASFFFPLTLTPDTGFKSDLDFADRQLAKFLF